MSIAFLAVPNAPNDIGPFIRWVLPALGISIIAFCIASFFFSFGQKFKESKQVIRGFGLDLEVSLLTLLLLIGVVATFTGVYLQVSNKEVAGLYEKITTLQTQLKDADDALKNAGRFTITADLVLPKEIKVSSLDVKKLECHYVLFDSSSHSANISPGLGGNSLQVQLVDIQRSDGIAELVLQDKETGKILGDAKGLRPLNPLFELQLPQ